jgi:hypothetical protein
MGYADNSKHSSRLNLFRVAKFRNVFFYISCLILIKTGKLEKIFRKHAILYE